MIFLASLDLMMFLASLDLMIFLSFLVKLLEKYYEIKSLDLMIFLQQLHNKLGTEYGGRKSWDRDDRR